MSNFCFIIIRFRFFVAKLTKKRETERQERADFDELPPINDELNDKVNNYARNLWGLTKKW